MRRFFSALVLTALLLSLTGCTALFAGSVHNPPAPTAETLPTLPSGAARLRANADAFLAAVPAGTYFEEARTPEQLRAAYQAPANPLRADIYEVSYDDDAGRATLRGQTAAVMTDEDGVPYAVEGEPWRFELCIEHYDSDEPLYVYCRAWPVPTTVDSAAGTTTTAGTEA